jgi:hypothetical protein
MDKHFDAGMRSQSETRKTVQGSANRHPNEFSAYNSNEEDYHNKKRQSSQASNIYQPDDILGDNDKEAYQSQKRSKS